MKGKLRVNTDNLSPNAKKGVHGINDPILRRDICVLFTDYLKGDAILDILANIPGIVYTIYLGSDFDHKDHETLDADKIYKGLMALKVLRLFHLDEVQASFNTLFTSLGNRFFLHAYMFDNIKSWFQTILKFILCTHYFACIWVIIENVKHERDIEGIDFVTSNWGSQYVESFYLITTTITTVGYGDYKAFNNESGVWAPEMVYLTFVTLAGTLLFTTVIEEVLTYKKLETVESIVANMKRRMEQYLYDISNVRDEKALDADLINRTLD